MIHEWGILEKKKVTLTFIGANLDSSIRDEIIRKGIYSNYLKPEHPFYERVMNNIKGYNIVSSYYFNKEVLETLLNYIEIDLENKIQHLIDNPPLIEEDNPFYGETCAVETVIHKGKTLTMDLIIHKEFREVWGLSKIVKSLQEEINLNGGLYLIYAEYLGDKKGI